MAKILFKHAYQFISRQSFYNIICKEVHLTESLRVDLLWLNWKDKVTIFEVKSCREDFEKDHKWKNYLDYCHNFFFVCPEGVIEKEDLPKEIGLIYLVETKDGQYKLRVKRSPTELKPRKITNAWLRYIFKKLAFRKFAKIGEDICSLEEEVFYPK